jgi:5-methylcytosine-specific restriction endonuclease McrA
MAISNKPPDEARKAQLQAELRRDVAQRNQGYRERALAVLPHICASCGREFSGKRLKELTVHHRDHDHTHNPPDGSNWELLCIYCHDHEHAKNLLAGHYEGRTATRAELKPSIFSQFEKLDSLIQLPPADENKTGEKLGVGTAR